MDHMCIRRFAKMSVESWKSYIVGKYIHASLFVSYFHSNFTIVLDFTFFFSKKDNLFFYYFFRISQIQRPTSSTESFWNHARIPMGWCGPVHWFWKEIVSIAKQKKSLCPRSPYVEYWRYVKVLWQLKLFIQKFRMFLFILWYKKKM